MTIIQFPGGPRRGDGDDVERAAELKRRLVDFVTRGPLKETHAAEMHETGIDEPEFHEFVDFTDWFIFEWESEDGARVLDEFIASEPGLTEADRHMLESWYDAVDDVFQVVSVTPEGVTLRDSEGETYFAVPTSPDGPELGWHPLTLVHTRLVPVGNVYLLSGIQSFYDGADLASLPEGIDVSAFGNVADGEAEGSSSSTTVVDVRSMSPSERPQGSMADAARAFLDETGGTLKTATLDGQAAALSLLALYSKEDVVRASELTAEDLLDFLAVWYPPIAEDRSLGATRALLASVGKFATWVGRRYGTDVGAEYRRRVLPALKDDLPRTIKAVIELERSAVPYEVDDSLASSARERTEPFRTRYAIVAIQGNTLTLRERAAETEAVAPLLSCSVPHSAAALLGLGDVLDGVFVSPGRSRVVATSIDCVYCPAAGV